MPSIMRRVSAEKPPNINSDDLLQDMESNTGHGPLSRQRAPTYYPTGAPFIGRLGGNQDFVLDRDDAANAELLKAQPDSAPCMTLREQFDLAGFRSPGLWKAALIESIGALLLNYLTIWAGLSPATKPTLPTAQFGAFNNASFIGPVVGGITTGFIVTLFTFCFGAVSGAHLNPAITIATFFARLCSLPRMVLYVSFQTAGGALAGLLVRASYGSRDFKVGGCYLFSDIVPVSNAFAIEFIYCCALLFMSFGVGLDPRQRQVLGPAMSPFLVGMTICVLIVTSSFTRYGYGGASLNPARCLGTFVGSRFPGWHWIHWVADILAAIVHGVVYFLVPPWTMVEK